MLLALAMFGFYELRLPAFIQDRLSNLNQKQQRWHVFWCVVNGDFVGISGITLCVSAPLAGALLYISSTGICG